MTTFKMPEPYTTHHDQITGHVFCDLFSEYQLKQALRDVLEQAAQICYTANKSIYPVNIGDAIRAMKEQIK